MITVDQFLAFGLAAFILIAIPGPSVVFTIGRALAYGRAKFLEPLRHASSTEIFIHVNECAPLLDELLKKIKARFV